MERSESVYTLGEEAFWGKIEEEEGMSCVLDLSGCSMDSDARFRLKDFYPLLK